MAIIYLVLASSSPAAKTLPEKAWNAAVAEDARVTPAGLLLGRRLSASRIQRRKVCGLTIETNALMTDPRGLARRTSRDRSPGVTRTGPTIFERSTSFLAFRY